MADKIKRLKILFFTHTAGLGGSERSLLELLDELRDKNVDCYVVIPHDGPFVGEIKKRGIPFVIIPYEWWCKEHQEFTKEEINLLIDQSVNSLLKNYDQLRKINPALIYTNTLTIPWGAMLAKMMGTPHIWRINEFGTLDFDQRYMLGFRDSMNYIHNSSNFVLTNSKSTLKHYNNQVGIANSGYVYPYVSISKNKLGEKSKHHFNRKHSFKIILPGFIHDGKNQLEAVKATRILRDRKLDVELMLLGWKNPDYVKLLNGYIAKNKLTPLIQICGPVDNPYPIMRQADAVLMCSKNEAFGRVTVEAMILKKPVIGTNSGATPELIKDGYNGFLYESGNFNELAKKIEILYRNRNLAKKMGENGYRFYKKKFSPRKYGSRILEIMEQVIKAKNEQKTNLGTPLLVHYLTQKIKSLQDEEINFSSLIKIKQTNLEKSNLELNNLYNEQINLNKKIQLSLYKAFKKLKLLSNAYNGQKTINRNLLKKLNISNDQLNKIYNSKTWKLLYLYKKFMSRMK